MGFRSKTIFAAKMPLHETYMRRCLHLARLGEGYVSPNPLVGSVIVNNGIIIGEGYHQHFGGAHAEVNAIDAVTDKSQLKSSTLYVNLEPCSHFGKTPPCTDLIIRMGIPSVVIGMSDPYAAVNGNGIRKLKEAGIDVQSQLLEEECRWLNKRFIMLQQFKRPYITLKWAMSANGIAGATDNPIRISNEESRIHAHHLRHTEQAILAGANTILCDNPQLNVREWNGRNPVRIIVDPKNKIKDPSGLHVFDGSQRTILFSFHSSTNFSNTEHVQLDPDQTLIKQVTDQLGKLQIDSVLVEGGPSLHRHFIENDLWDECYIYQSNERLNEGISAPLIPHGKITISQIGDNQLIHIQRN